MRPCKAAGKSRFFAKWRWAETHKLHAGGFASIRQLPDVIRQVARENGSLSFAVEDSAAETFAR
jgi:hypothetical protein